MMILVKVKLTFCCTMGDSDQSGSKLHIMDLLVTIFNIKSNITHILSIISKTYQ
jgi:hypothetical protein